MMQTIHPRTPVEFMISITPELTTLTGLACIPFYPVVGSIMLGLAGVEGIIKIALLRFYPKREHRLDDLEEKWQPLQKLVHKVPRLSLSSWEDGLMSLQQLKDLTVQLAEDDQESHLDMVLFHTQILRRQLIKFKMHVEQVINRKYFTFDLTDNFYLSSKELSCISLEQLVNDTHNLNTYLDQLKNNIKEHLDSHQELLVELNTVKNRGFSISVEFKKLLKLNALIEKVNGII